VWPGVGVGVFLLRETPTLSVSSGQKTFRYSLFDFAQFNLRSNFACTTLYTIVHLLLEERFSLKYTNITSWNQSRSLIFCQESESESHKNKDSAFLV